MDNGSKTQLYYVQITEPTTGKFRIFYLYDGIESNEFKDLFVVSFDNIQGVVGFCDENGVYFPISLLSTKPQLFGGRKLTIVSSKSSLSSKLPLIGNDSEDTIVTEDQVAKAFQLLDINGDTFVHKEEFIQFMTGAYYNLFEQEPGLAFAYSCVDSKELAIATAIICYQACNPVGSYYLTYDDFCAWYMSCGFDPIRELMIKAIAAYNLDNLRAGEQSNQSTPTLKRSKSCTNLTIGHCYEDLSIQIYLEHCKEVFPLATTSTVISFLTQLSREYKHSTLLSFANMKGLLNKYLCGTERQQSEHNDVIQQIYELLFTILSDKKTQTINFAQLVSFFLINSPVQSPEIYKILYLSYHEHAYEGGSGSTSAELVNDIILYNHLCPIIRLIYFFNPDYSTMTRCQAEQVTHAIYIKLVTSVDVQRRSWGKLTFAEFIELYSHGLRLALQILQIDEGYFVELLAKLVGYKENNSIVLGASTDEEEDEDTEVDDDKETEEEGADTSDEEEEEEEALRAGIDDTGRMPSIDSLEDDQVSSFFIGYNGSPITITNGRRILGLVEYTTYDVVKYLMQLCDTDGYITPTIFTRGVLRLIGDHYIELSVLERSIADFMLDRLMETFTITGTTSSNATSSNDADNEESSSSSNTNIMVLYSFFDICIGLLLYCEDDSYNRAEIILALLRPKAIRLSTVTTVLAILFKACYCLHPGLTREQYTKKAESDSRSFCIQYYMKEVSPKFGEVINFTNSQFIHIMNAALMYLDALSEQIHNEANNQVDVDDQQHPPTHPQDSIFTDSFTKELEEMESRTTTSEPSIRSFSDDDDNEDGLKLYLNDERFPPSSTVLELRAATAILGLEKYRADHLLDRLGKESFAGRISAAGWANWLALVMQDSHVSEYDTDIAINLTNKIYASFQHGGDEDISYEQVVAGLAFLCSKSPIEERLTVAFTVMDDNGDGLISYDQFVILIRSVIIVMSVCSRQVAKRILSVGVSIDDLAQAAAKEGWGALDLPSPDDELTLELLCDLAEDYVKLASII